MPKILFVYVATIEVNYYNMILEVFIWIILFRLMIKYGIFINSICQIGAFNTEYNSY